MAPSASKWSAMEHDFLIDIVDFSIDKGREKSCAGVTVCTRTHLMSGIRFARNSGVLQVDF